MTPQPDNIAVEIRALIDDIVLGTDEPDVGERLAAIDIHVAGAGVESFKTVAKQLGGNPDVHGPLAVVFAALARSPYPAGALVNFHRYVETVGVSGTFLGSLAEAEPLREILATVFGSSQYMADIIIRNPGYLYWLTERETWESEDDVDSYKNALVEDVSKFDSVESKLNAARRFQRRMLLAIGVRDLVGELEIEAVTARLSALAQAIVQVVIDVMWNEIVDNEPEEGLLPRADRCGFAVLALGKLGGGELNYSSDIDLIYVSADVDAAAAARYHQLGTRLTDALSSVTSEGYLYRTDLRLRPDGASGPLVHSLTAMRIYYESRARPWEFQAMLKARVLAGDPAVGDECLGYISGLLRNPSLSYSPVDDIALMRVRIRENISDHDRAFNIKLMEGGIRDIEFITQTLQLLHGNRFADLRTPNTLEGIRRAHDHELIKTIEMETMKRAYVFFRLIEHRLQMMHQFKTHSVPESPEEIELLARRASMGPLGRFRYDSFVSALASHLTKVRHLAESFFAGEGMPDTAMLALIPDDEELAKKTLARYGFEEPRQAFSIIQSLAYGSFPHLVDRTTRASFQKYLPLLLDSCSRAGDPNLALGNFSRLSEASRSESAFYGFLTDIPTARFIVRNLTATSSILTNKLCLNPETIDMLLEDPDHLLTVGGDERDALDRFAESPTPVTKERLVSSLRRTIDRRLLAAWVIDNRDESFPATMSRGLTDTMRELVAMAFSRFVGERPGAALLAMGSFGVGEPRINSDADLLVVADGENLEPLTRSIQKLNQLFTDGALLKIDFRLRGEGANAPLVQDLTSYIRYFESRMAPWEHVAFAKCAVWAGEEELAQTFLETLAAVIRSPLTSERLEALESTRCQLETLVGDGERPFETKRSAGGRFDIEYLSAMGLAQSGAEHPLDASTFERLEILAEAGVISADEWRTLAGAFTLFTQVDFLLELQGFSRPTNAEKSRKIERYLDRSLELLGIRINKGIITALAESKSSVRAVYTRFLTDLRNSL
jgi:glutamate-ammonia-ligase adenylyltransferase